MSAGPPYFNLERYSTDALDLSNLSSYALFLEKYRRIIKATTSLLRPRHLACFVVGNLRDTSGDGSELTLHADTTAAFKDAGCVMFQDAVLATALGSAPMRASRIANAGSKLVCVHQHVVVAAKDAMLRPCDHRALGFRARSDSQQASQQ